MRNWKLIKQSKLPKIESKVISNLSSEKYGLKFGELNNTTGTESVNGLAGYLSTDINVRMSWLSSKQTNDGSRNFTVFNLLNINKCDGDDKLRQC